MGGNLIPLLVYRFWRLGVRVIQQRRNNNFLSLRCFGARKPQLRYNQFSACTKVSVAAFSGLPLHVLLTEVGNLSPSPFLSRHCTFVHVCRSELPTYLPYSLSPPFPYYQSWQCCCYSSFRASPMSNVYNSRRNDSASSAHGTNESPMQLYYSLSSSVSPT